MAVDKYIALGPGENARYLRNLKITNIDPSNGQVLAYNSATNEYTPSTGGDVVGPGSSTDHALVRFDGTDGATLQDSGIIADDSDNITGINSMTMKTLIATNVITTGDNLIVLNDDVTGSPSEDAGIEVERGNSTNTQLLWNETTDKWQHGVIGSLANISDAATLQTVAINSTAPAAEDVLSYNSVDAEWAPGAGGGGTDISPLTVNSTTGDILNTNTDTDWTIKQDDVSGNASSIIFQASSDTSNVAILGDVIFKTGSSPRNAQSVDFGGSFFWFLNIDGFEEAKLGMRLIHPLNSEGPSFGNNSVRLIMGKDRNAGYIEGDIGNTKELVLGTGATPTMRISATSALFHKVLISDASNVDIGYPGFEFDDAYFVGTHYIGPADGNRIEIGNQSIVQDTSLTGVNGKDLSITAGAASDGTLNGGHLNLAPGADTGGEPGTVNVANFESADYDGGGVDAVIDRFPVYAPNGAIYGYVPVYSSS